MPILPRSGHGGFAHSDELRGKRDSEIPTPELAAMGVEAARRVKATGKPIVEDRTI